MVSGLRDTDLDDAEIDRLFHALSDATRRDIVTQAMHGDRSVSAIARDYTISLPAVQKHVAVLERAGLVTKRRQGREQIVTSNIESIRDARRILDRLEQTWRGRIDRIGDLLVDPAPRSQSDPLSDNAQGEQP